MNAAEILDRAAKACNAHNDSALARALRVSRQTVCNVRSGTRDVDIEIAAKIAAMAGLPLHFVLGTINEAAATTAPKKHAWRRLAQAAAITFLAVLLVPSTAKNEGFAVSSRSANPPNLFIMFQRLRKRWRMVWRSTTSLRPALV